MPPRHLPYEIYPDKCREHFYETHWKHVSLALLVKHCQPAGQTVLDFGCGRGETLEIFGAAGFAVTGTDVDAECVRLASRFGPVQILDPQDPLGQFGRKSFDIITCFHVLEHVDSPKKTLKDLAAITRQYILLAVPNLRYLNLLFTRHVNISIVNEGHLQSWDHWHLLNLAERHCGLKLVDWGFDATRLPILSHAIATLFGQKAAISVETGLFRKAFPFHGISIIGLFRVL